MEPPAIGPGMTPPLLFRDMYLLQSSAYQHTPLPDQHQPPSMSGELAGEGT